MSQLSSQPPVLKPFRTNKRLLSRNIVWNITRGFGLIVLCPSLTIYLRITIKLPERGLPVYNCLSRNKMCQHNNVKTGHTRLEIKWSERSYCELRLGYLLLPLFCHSSCPKTQRHHFCAHGTRSFKWNGIHTGNKTLLDMCISELDIVELHSWRHWISLILLLI